MCSMPQDLVYWVYHADPITGRVEDVSSHSSYEVARREAGDLTETTSVPHDVDTREVLMGPPAPHPAPI